MSKKKYVVLGYLGSACIAGVLLWCFLTSKVQSEPRQADGQDEILNWLLQDSWNRNGENNLGIAVAGTDDMYYIQLSDDKDGGSKLAMLQTDSLSVIGRNNVGRGLFEGSIEWNGQEIYVVNFATLEYMKLRENLNSFMLGDYYVSCRYQEDAECMELLVFYCPLS